MTLALILVVVLFLTIVLAVFSFGVAAYAPSSVIGSRLRSLAGAQKGRPEKTAFKERLEQALDPFSKALPLSATEVSRARAWLIQAGYRDPRHLTMYVGSRVLLGVLGMLVVVAVSGLGSPLLLVGAGGLGFFLPRFWLKRKIKARQRLITLGLPDALDLTVICVEAGLALDQALMRVGEDLSHSHPELSAEFHMFNLETRAGKPRVGFAAHRAPPESRGTSRQDHDQDGHPPGVVHSAFPPRRHHRASIDSVVPYARAGGALKPSPAKDRAQE